jgi:hypothetical protein
VVGLQVPWFNRIEMEDGVLVSPRFNTAMSGTLSELISPWKFPTVKAVPATPTV